MCSSRCRWPRSNYPMSRTLGMIGDGQDPDGYPSGFFLGVQDTPKPPFIFESNKKRGMEHMIRRDVTAVALLRKTNHITTAHTAYDMLCSGR